MRSARSPTTAAIFSGLIGLAGACGVARWRPCSGASGFGLGDRLGDSGRVGADVQGSAVLGELAVAVIELGLDLGCGRPERQEPPAVLGLYQSVIWFEQLVHGH